MRFLKTAILPALCASVGGSLFAFTSCNNPDSQSQEQNTFDPVGTYALYSISDGKNTYTEGKTALLRTGEQTLRMDVFKEQFLFTFHADGTADYFIFGEEEMFYGTWQESESDYTVTMEVDGKTMQAKGDDAFLTWTDEGLTYIFQKTQLPETEAYSVYYGKYTFSSLTANGVEYLEGEEYLDFAPLSKENYQYYLMPNGFLHVYNSNETYWARWKVHNGALIFLLPYADGAKSYPATIDTLGVTLKVTLEYKDDHNVVRKECWEYHQD